MIDVSSIRSYKGLCYPYPKTVWAKFIVRVVLVKTQYQNAFLSFSASVYILQLKIGPQNLKLKNVLWYWGLINITLKINLAKLIWDRNNTNTFNSRLNKHLSRMLIYYKGVDISLSWHVYNIHLYAFCHNLEDTICEHF